MENFHVAVTRASGNLWLYTQTDGYMSLCTTYFGSNKIYEGLFCVEMVKPWAQKMSGPRLWP